MHIFICRCYFVYLYTDIAQFTLILCIVLHTFFFFREKYFSIKYFPVLFASTLSTEILLSRITDKSKDIKELYKPLNFSILTPKCSRKDKHRDSKKEDFFFFPFGSYTLCHIFLRTFFLLSF